VASLVRGDRFQPCRLPRIASTVAHGGEREGLVLGRAEHQPALAAGVHPCSTSIPANTAGSVLRAHRRRSWGSPRPRSRPNCDAPGSRRQRRSRPPSARSDGGTAAISQAASAGDATQSHRDQRITHAGRAQTLEREPVGQPLHVGGRDLGQAGGADVRDDVPLERRAVVAQAVRLEGSPERSRGPWHDCRFAWKQHSQTVAARQRTVSRARRIHRVREPADRG
jgi:hypothetical protein